MNILKIIDNIDYKITAWIHYNIGLNKNSFLRNLPYYFGLLPYEIYVLPGMFIALFSTYWEKSHTPLQFHLLPHLNHFSFHQI